MTEEKIQIRVVRSRRKSICLEIKEDGSVVLRAPYGVSESKLKKFVRDREEWLHTHLARQEQRRKEAGEAEPLEPEEIRRLAAQAAEVIPERCAFYAEKLGVDYGRITIRCQKTRWGSCSAKGNLNFNCLLMLTPPEVIDSVVVHELCHRKEMNHSKRFYQLIDSVYPEYDRWNRWLKKNGRILMLRVPRE